MNKIFLSVVIACLVLSYASTCICGTNIIQELGGSRVKAVQYENGDWELFAGGKPYFIKGVIYVPVKIGESPGIATMRDWMYYDDNKNGKNDVAYEVWVDKNKNNVQDNDEKAVGDFQILKEMGVNTIRLYHLPSDNPILGKIYKNDKGTQLQFDHAVNKELLRDLYNTYGIRVLLGNFLGSWTIGAGASWTDGCDYTNKTHRDNIKKSVKAMVLDNRDEDYVLMWLLGNENNIAAWSKCNARQNIKEYYSLVNEIAIMVKELDPTRPVAICEGYSAEDIALYKECLPDVDIFAFNAYFGDTGFWDIWDLMKQHCNKPAFISEYGQASYNKIDGNNEEQQLSIHRGCFIDLMINKAGGKSPVFGKGAGNCLGSVIYDYLDRWYMDGSPDQHSEGTKFWENSKDHISHEEYYGITSMGDGKHNYFKRQLKETYYFYQKQWPKIK